MSKRRKMSYKKSRADFSRKSGMHPKNALSGSSPSMRGGIRL